MITAMPRIAIAVADFEAAVETFQSVLGLPVADLSAETVPDLGAHIAMCAPEGGSNIELMAVSDPASPLGASLRKFIDRRGEGLFALMLEAPDPDAEADELLARGMDVLPLMAGASGRDIHPRSTHGVLIRVYPDNSVQLDIDRTPAEPELSGIETAIIATKDAAAAAERYRAGLGLDVDEAETDPDRGVLSARCRPPVGGEIELVSVTDSGRSFGRQIDDFVNDRGEGLYALVLRGSDPAQAVEVLRSRGLACTDTGETSVCGARVLVR